MQKLELKRSVWHDGRYQPIGSIIETDSTFFAELLIGYGKAQRIIEKSKVKKKNANAV